MYSGFLRRLTRRLCVIFLCALAAAANAQNARFVGQITDAQNAVVPQANIEITNQDTGVQLRTTSDDAGNYSVPYLTAGHYRVLVQAAGFDLSAHDVQLDMGQALIFNVQLSVAGSETTVSVQAGAELTQLHLDSNEISGTITGKEVSGIQLNGRNFSQLIALAPGVSNQTQQDEARVGMAGSVSFSVNGGRTEYNSFEADGSELLNVGINKDHTSLIVTPSIDAIQEIKVLTSNYGAMYPSTGSGTTLVTTKSGSDAFHGSLYEFLRNEALNSKGYFDVGKSAPLYRRNDFGGTIGGPVAIPHLYNGAGKTHFFYSEEARIEKDPYAYRQAVPSLEERNGDFSDVCPPLANGQYTTFNRTQYPDCPAQAGNFTFVSNQINNPGYLPGSGGPYVLNENALAILDTGVIPLPNAMSGCNSTGTACYLADVSLPTYWRQELFRVDHAVNDKLQASFRYIHDEWDETTPVPQYAYLQNTFPTIQNRFYAPGTSLVVRISGAISPTFLNDFAASYTDSNVTLRDIPGPGASLRRPTSLDAACVPDAVQCPLTTIFNNRGAGIDGLPKTPGVVIGGNNGEYGGYGFAADSAYMPWRHTNPTYSITDNMSKIIGRHNLQFGAEWIIFQRNQTNGPIGAASGDTQGILTFSDIGAKAGTGNAFANFLFTQPAASGGPGNDGGYISSFQQDSAQGRYRQRYQIVEPYIQDDFKLSPRLTLNLGLRVSLFGTYHEANDQAYNWESAAFSQSAAQTVRVGPGGNLIDVSSQAPISINQSNPQIGLDPRIINGIVRCGRGGRPASCMSGHLFNPAPRVGFAWDPAGTGKMAIRGGYGIFFEHGTADESNTGSLEGGAPIVVSMTDSFPSGWSSIGGGFAFPINVTAIPAKVHWASVQQWSLSLERQLQTNTLASFAYVGSVGRHLTAERELNQLTPATAANNPFAAHVPLKAQGPNPAVPGVNFLGDCTPSAPGSSSYTLLSGAMVSPGDPSYPNLMAACLGNGAGGTTNALRTFAPGIGEIYSLENIANSGYNAFQGTLRRVQGPMTLGVAYTYSHSIDNASDRSDATFVNSFDLATNRASSNFDQRHLIHVSYIYDLPLLRFFDSMLHFADSDASNQAANYPGHTYDPKAWQDSKIVQRIFDGWQLSGITLFESGIPFTVVNNGSPTGVSTLDNAGVANGVGSGSYPDRSGISAHSFRPHGNSKSFGPLLLNPGAFVAPRGLTFGNAGRNDLNNPHRWNWDVALVKHIPLGERMSADFRAEAFNLFNATQFRIYDPTLGFQAQNEVSCYGGDSAYYSAAGGDGVDCLTGSSFLHPVDAHRPRTLQVALKFLF